MKTIFSIKTSKLEKYIFFLLVLFLSACSTKNNSTANKKQEAINPIVKELTDSLTIELKAIAKTSLIPGFAASILQGDKVIYSKGFGYSDLVNKHKFSPQTINIIASISKTFIGAAIMKLVEDGKLKLDDPVNDYLPFEIWNPHFPKTVITIRHLVTHTSSLNDDFDDGEKRPSQLLEQSRYNKDEMPKELAGDIYYWDGTAIPLEKYLEQAFKPNGKWYAKSNFSNFKPGEKYEYSNEGSNLAGLIVERVSGISFSEFTQKYIFQPLNMTNSYWEYQTLDSTISKLYTQYEKEYPSKVFEFPRAIDSGQPCGDLKSSADDLSKYLGEMMNGFNGKGKILNAASYQTLLNPQLSRDKFDNDDESVFNDDYDVGVFWAISKPGLRLHKGGSIGVYSILYFNPTSNIGVISYCNLAHPDFGKIVNTLRVYEEKLSKKLIANR